MSPTNSAPFEVLSLFTCDFVSQDRDSNLNALGIHIGSVYLPEGVQVLPQWYFVVVLRPIIPAFKFFVDFDAPERKRIFRVTLDYQADEPIPEHTRVVCASQIPGVRFPGGGDYSLRVRDTNMDTVHRRILPVGVGRKPSYRARLDANAELNAEYGQVIEIETTTTL